METGKDFTLKLCLHNEHSISILRFMLMKEMGMQMPQPTCVSVLQYVLSYDTSYIQIFCS